MEQEMKFAPGSVFLVTGGAGFIGSNLCERLVDMGYPVRCLDNFSTGSMSNIHNLINHPLFTLIEADIRDYQACKKACQGVDYVLHQAAWGSVPRSIEMPVLYEAINIQGTLNMLEAARKAQVKVFVYASSSSVYGDCPDLKKVEGHEGKVLSPYALTKVVNEKYAKLYTSLYGLKTIGLRYFNVFGPRQNPSGSYAAVIPKFITMLMNGETPTINGDGTQSRDFTYIENVIQANLLACLANEKAFGQAFNIGCDNTTTLNALYEMICQKLEVQIKQNHGIYRKGDVQHSQASLEKSQLCLGYSPSWSVSNGIKETINWYKRANKPIDQGGINT